MGSFGLIVLTSCFLVPGREHELVTAPDPSTWVLLVTLSGSPLGWTVRPVYLFDGLHEVLLGLGQLILEAEVIVLLLDLVYVGSQLLLDVHILKI